MNGTQTYNIFDLGFDKFLSKISYSLDIPGTDLSLPSAMESVFSGAANPANLVSGELVGNISVKDGYLRSANYVSGSAGWILNYDGSVEIKDLTLFGGIIKYNKTSFTDTTNAGYFISSSGIYFGAAADATKLKFTIATGALEVGGLKLISLASGSSIDGQYIQNLSIQTEALANLAVTAAKIDNATITATQIANATITAIQIANATITGTQIAATTILAGNIGNGTITTTQISATAGIVGGQIASATIAGGNIAATTITASNITNLTITASQIANLTITSGKVNTALMSYSHNIVFSVASDIQINWAAGTITTSDGTTYTISAGNTGTMTAKNYIYLDIAVSTTVLQKTTTFSTAVGDGKMLIAVAQNNTTEAVFQVFNGIGGTNLAGGNIVANSITANEIAASTITATQIAANTITASQIAANTITASQIAAGTITATQIAASTITANEISTGLYNQIDANLPSDVNLVGYWNFDEGKDSTANDGSGNGNTGTLTNMEAGDWVAGVVGTALDFDGVNEFVGVSDNASLNNLNEGTIALWVKPDDVASKHTVVSNGNAVALRSYFVGFGEVVGKIYFHFYADDWDSTVSISANVWTHIVVTYKKINANTTRKIYKNGELADEYTSGSLTGLTGNLFIGKSGIGAADSYDGLMDEVRIYSAALTAKEVYALYKNPAGNKGVMIPTGRLTSGSIYSKQITLAVADGTGDSYIAGGNALDLANWRGGDANAGAFILGLDDSVAQNPAKLFMGNYSTSKYLLYDGTDISVIGGTITGSTITGGLIRTAASGNRVEIRKTGDELYPNEIVFIHGVEGTIGRIIGNWEVPRLAIRVTAGLEFQESGGAFIAVIQADESYFKTALNPLVNNTQQLGSSSLKWNAIYRTNEFSCDLPTHNSATDVFKKLKPPVLQDGDFGKRKYFKVEDFPAEMKAKNDKGEDDIELTRTLGVTVQAVKELVDKVEQLETKII